MENLVLQSLSESDIPNSKEFANQNNYSVQQLHGLLNSLASDNFVTLTVHESSHLSLNKEALQYLHDGSPQYRIFLYIKQNQPQTMPQLTQVFGPLLKIGYAQAMRQKWLACDKQSKEITTIVQNPQDSLALILSQFHQHGEQAKINIDDLKKRKLLDTVKQSYFQVSKGPNFKLNRVKQAANLTKDMLRTGAWKTTPFKPINFKAKGKPITSGCLHPLLKVRQHMRQVLLEMGFQEMPTNNFVQASFWNFDTLFQPQAHPARDAHDTFFIKDPAYTQTFPQDYLERVKEVHINGGYGSIGWNYDWSLQEAKKNILRTHTTAVSARMLYKLAQEGFQPKKYFSIDKVFRNQNLDQTHLAEFHQFEGVIADRGMSLADLKGIITEFFRRQGITNLKFKPAYNPYTEPSMEIFGYHPILKEWCEIGNSGVFRPEMLRPMGLPEDVSVLGWGLSVERPTMIHYKIANIRELFGHKLSISNIRKNPICRFNRED